MADALPIYHPVSIKPEFDVHRPSRWATVCVAFLPNGRVIARRCHIEAAALPDCGTGGKPRRHGLVDCPRVDPDRPRRGEPEIVFVGIVTGPRNQVASREYLLRG